MLWTITYEQEEPWRRELVSVDIYIDYDYGQEHTELTHRGSDWVILRLSNQWTWMRGISSIVSCLTLDNHEGGDEG